jgi:hypothetical protein
VSVTSGRHTRTETAELTSPWWVLSAKLARSTRQRASATADVTPTSIATSTTPTRSATVSKAGSDSQLRSTSPARCTQPFETSTLIPSSETKLFNSGACRTAARTAGSVRATLAAGVDRLFAGARALWAHPFVSPCSTESRRPIGERPVGACPASYLWGRRLIPGGRAAACRCRRSGERVASRREHVPQRTETCGSLPVGLAGRRVTREPVEGMSVIGHLLGPIRPFGSPEKRAPYAAASGWLAGRHKWGPCRGARTGAGARGAGVRLPEVQGPALGVDQNGSQTALGKIDGSRRYAR